MDGVKGLISNSRQKTDCSNKRAMRRQLGGTRYCIHPLVATGDARADDRYRCSCRSTGREGGVTSMAANQAAVSTGSARSRPVSTADGDGLRTAGRCHARIGILLAAFKPIAEFVCACLISPLTSKSRARVQCFRPCQSAPSRIIAPSSVRLLSHRASDCPSG